MKDYTKILTNLFKPKTNGEEKKLKKLEKLMVEYIVSRFIEEMPKNTLSAFKNEVLEYKKSEDIANFLKSNDKNFQSKLDTHIEDFLNTYVRNI